MNESRVRSTRAAARVSRRRFLKLTAAGAAAALAVPAATLARAAATAKGATPAKSAAPAKGTAPAAATGKGARVASAKEIEKLRGYLDGSLKAVRNFELPPGSDMAFSFRAMKPRRARKEG